MGAFLDKPKTEKHTAHGQGNGLHYGLSSMQGWRVEMEDAHTAMVGLPHGLTDWSFFAVYDGHAGSRVANYCSANLLEHILLGGAEFTPGMGSVEGVKDGIRAGFLKIDEYMRSFSDLRQGLDRSGSTAVGVLLSPSHLYFINCGDSRADHKPCNPREKERIQNAGGSVMIQRVNGSLAVSRALGDYDYKCVDGKGPTEQLVSPEPEVCVLERAAEGDEFVVLACDGIWDVMSNEELCEFVRSRLQVFDDLERVCNAVVSEQALKKEEELDKYLETRVEDLLGGCGEEGVPDLVCILRNIASENIPNLPPGGGLASKRSVIEAVYSRLNPHREEEGACAGEVEFEGEREEAAVTPPTSWRRCVCSACTTGVSITQCWRKLWPSNVCLGKIQPTQEESSCFTADYLPDSPPPSPLSPPPSPTVVEMQDPPGRRGKQRHGPSSSSGRHRPIRSSGGRHWPILDPPAVDIG
ncbi:unnamed protein product [Coregonus sp. 'balchen']|nr:unnamed protein product [Coregonus sp. 'balchen']